VTSPPDSRAPAGDGRPPAGPATPRLITIGLRGIRAVLGTLILAGVAINFANVVGRYVFLRPIIWAEEILVFIMVWCVMLGAVVVTWEDRHLRMDAVYHLTAPRVHRWLDLTSTVLFLLAGLFVLVQSARVVALVASTGQRSVVAEVPMVIPYGAILLSFAMIVGVLAWRLRRFVAGERPGPASAPAGPGRERRGRAAPVLPGED
jgi:TRAP-type C4-dicarboxylate transport system permease small subunit